MSYKSIFAIAALAGFYEIFQYLGGYQSVVLNALSWVCLAAALGVAAFEIKRFKPKKRPIKQG